MTHSGTIGSLVKPLLGPFFGSLVVVGLESQAFASFIVFEANSATPASITPTRDAFRTAVGGGTVAGAKGDFGLRLEAYSLPPYGKRLAYSGQNAETGYDLWTLPLNTSDPEHPKPGQREPSLRTFFDERGPAFSPDGRWGAARARTWM